MTHTTFCEKLEKELKKESDTLVAYLKIQPAELSFATFSLVPLVTQNKVPEFLRGGRLQSEGWD